MIDVFSRMISVMTPTDTWKKHKMDVKTINALLSRLSSRAHHSSQIDTFGVRELEWPAMEKALDKHVAGDDCAAPAKIHAVCVPCLWKLRIALVYSINISP